MSSPAVVVLGGPNGAGKSTAAPRLLRGSLKVEEFVNADTLAHGLSAFRPEDVALEAGRIMLKDSMILNLRERALRLSRLSRARRSPGGWNGSRSALTESTSCICGCQQPNSPLPALLNGFGREAMMCRRTL